MPSGSGTRKSLSSRAVPLRTECIDRPSASRSAGCTSSRIDSGVGVKVFGSTPNRRYSSSDHVSRPVARSHSQLPSPATSWASESCASRSAVAFHSNSFSFQEAMAAKLMAPMKAPWIPAHVHGWSMAD